MTSEWGVRKLASFSSRSHVQMNLQTSLLRHQGANSRQKQLDWRTVKAFVCRLWFPFRAYGCVAMCGLPFFWGASLDSEFCRGKFCDRGIGPIWNDDLIRCRFLNSEVFQDKTFFRPHFKNSILVKYFWPLSTIWESFSEMQFHTYVLGSSLGLI